MVSVELAPAVMLAGLKEPVMPAGSATSESAIGWAAPLVTALVTVNVVEPPRATEGAVGLSASEKSFITIMLLTVTITGAEVPTLPAASNARVVRVWAPLATPVVSQLVLKGGAGFIAIRTPSTWNSTRVTPTLSVALAEMVVVPLTVAPLGGAVMLVLGGVVSAVPVHRSNLKVPIRVCQALLPAAMYWEVNQNVQSSVGST